MPKLIYVYGDDNALLDTMVTALRTSGYSLEYTVLGEDVKNVSADIALICKSAAPGNRMTMGGVTVDLDNLTATDATGNAIHFTPTEFALLSYLLRHASRAVPRSELLSAVWHYDTASATRVADDTVKRLRKKLQDTRLRIETVWGYGFKIYEQPE